MSLRVFTVPPGTPFVDAVAAGIRDRVGDDPMALAAATVLLPTRRACRSLREAFLRANGGAPTLLPRLRPVGDVDADELAVANAGWEGAADSVLAVPPAIPALRRRLLLSQLVLELDRKRAGGGAMVAEQALFLATELAAFLDQMQIEEISVAALDGIVPDSLAGHWQDTLVFLRIVTEEWPKVLAGHGALDPAERRRRLLDLQVDLWRRAPPATPVIAAGSTGSVPATARLLAAVAALPAGAVILPGLDRDLPDAAWDGLPSTHPQSSMRDLLRRIGVARDKVGDWPAPGVRAGDPRRARLLNHSLRPQAMWSGDEQPWVADATRDLYAMTSAGSEQEARAIALALREALEQPERTAALVTPDRGLARRVAAELTRWGVEVDDSAGLPLALTGVGAFLRLVAVMLAEHVAPVPLLAALKHPLAAGGLAAGEFRRRVRALERAVLRGPRPAPGFAGLAAAVEAWGDAPRDHGNADGNAGGKADAARRQRAAKLLAWLRSLADAAAPFRAELDSGQARLGDLVRAHIEFAEAVAADDANAGGARLWRGADGEAAALWLDEVLRESAEAPPFDGAQYPAVLTELMAGVVVRPRWPRHPRVHIWGPLEARLQQADVVVLGGLNEGTWPPDTGTDPWMSRPMRAQAGLPPRERRVGLSAHDFVQAAAAPVAILSRAERVAGAPTVPSRWLVSLDAVLHGAGASLPAAPWTAWAAALDDPGAPQPLPPPRPTPPLAARPRKLAATRVEAWVRDPYSIYARHVLNLSRLDDVDVDPGAADRGRFIHDAVDRFLRTVGEGPLPADALDRLLHCGEQAFGPALARPDVRAFWWPRFARTAAWFVATERARRAESVLAGSEIEGARKITAPAGPFTVTARADRIDRLGGGGLAIVDYKTGAAPAKKDILSGFSPQLAVEALIAEAGGFPGIAAEPASELALWILHGLRDGGEVRNVNVDVPSVVAETLAGLERLVAAFDDAAMPYLSRPRPDLGPRYSDYDHLARIQEWSAGSGTGDGQ